MSLDDNKAVVRRSLEAFNAKDLSAADVYSEDVRRELQHHLDSMPWSDYQIDITELIAEGERVAAVIATRGVHSAHYNEMPPTGKSFTNRGVVTFRVQGGRLTEMEAYIDSLTVVQQLGGTIRAPGESS